MSARLPAETKVDSPSPRWPKRSRMDPPSAPDWLKNPTRPAGGVAGHQRGVHENVGIGVDDAECVRTHEPHARAMHEADQIGLQRQPIGAGSPEAARDHDESMHPRARRILDDGRHPGRTHHDDGQVDGLLDVSERRTHRTPAISSTSG